MQERSFPGKDELIEKIDNLKAKHKKIQPRITVVLLMESRVVHLFHTVVHLFPDLEINEKWKQHEQIKFERQNHQ